jgi:hypothetical protein
VQTAVRHAAAAAAFCSWFLLLYNGLSNTPSSRFTFTFDLGIIGVLSLRIVNKT